MTNRLEVLIRESGFGVHGDSLQRKVDDQKAVACAVERYLTEQPAVATTELRAALTPIKNEIPKTYEHGSYSREIYDLSHYYHLGNPFLAANIPHVSVPEAVRRVLGIDKKWDISIRSGSRANKGRVIIYFKTEESLREYVRPRIKEERRVVQVLFNEDLDDT